MPKSLSTNANDLVLDVMQLTRRPNVWPRLVRIAVKYARAHMRRCPAIVQLAFLGRTGQYLVLPHPPPPGPSRTILRLLSYHTLNFPRARQSW
ncbi:hypothetical protein J6590_028035 [Homalodisca vitripennis]|nr:hypothetical protein J6590_028035 [Homalodisca vitripennis]